MYLEIALIVLSLASLGLLGLIWKRSNSSHTEELLRQLIQAEFQNNRQELAQALRDNRQELQQSLENLTQRLDEKLQSVQQNFHHNAKENRDELTSNLKNFQESFRQNVQAFNQLQQEKFATITQQQEQLIQTTEKKLENMRQTVDEKLHKTLEERLGQSFKIVSERLEAVQKGLGEMQNLATGVGDLKKVLSNVKTRGVLGEIQLGNILEQLLAPEQYDTNVKTKSGSNDHVEYAIKLPGQEDATGPVYLPIDAKFPQEDYLRLQEAYDQGDTAAIDSSTRALTQAIKKFAKDIQQKYIDPPHTTDFGILFLPIEGLFAEVVRQPELIAQLQRDHKIIVTGPTTLAAMLNSLQMGFKTLAIQKSSGDIRQILGAVKTEFSKFGEVLAKAQKKMGEANNELDTLIGTRTRMMISKLKKVEELPSEQSSKLLDLED